MLAHVGGVPVEEVLPTVAGSAAAGVIVARGWIRARLHRLLGPGR